MLQTEADRQRLLESKAAAYDSLQRGERQDTDGVYAVDFAAQPGFVRGGVLEDDLEARGPGAASSLDAHRSSGNSLRQTSEPSCHALL